MEKLKENIIFQTVGKTVFYLAILILLVILYGFHDMSAGPFIYTEF